MASLGSANLRIPKVIPNVNGQQIMTFAEDQYLYQAVVFSRVEGEHPSEMLVMTPTFLKALGALIARMHEVSQKYEGGLIREQWFEERGIRHALEAASVSENAPMREKLNTAMQWIHGLEKTDENYGLVHADLGFLNLFVMPDGSIGVIDFDDACYHFHAFDLAIVIYSMVNRFKHLFFNALEKEWVWYLVEGYRSVRPLQQEQVDQIPRFIAFACLRLYFWIEYHQSLNTFHSEVIERIANMKQWAFDRLRGSDW